MSYVPPLDDSKPRPKLSRELDPVEVRILGCLAEKQLATPEYYPLTLNALVAACNQKSNREPVMELSDQDVQRALDRLQDEKLVWKVMGGRAVRFDHNLDRLWHLSAGEKALITLLLLRGAQTAGELRGRSDRLHSFTSIAEVEETLRNLAAGSEPLVAPLSRRPGQKEERWAHLAGGLAADALAEDGRDGAGEVPRTAGEPLAARVTRLEQLVGALAADLAALKAKLGE